MSVPSSVEWNDYQWHLKHSVRSGADIPRFFPVFPPEKLQEIRTYETRYRFHLTPYLLRCLHLGEKGNPDPTDPLVQLFFPDPTTLLSAGLGTYDPSLMNWEMPGELVVPGSLAFQWKYDDRLLYRSTGCLSICSYCFEAHRVIDRTSSKKPFRTDWERGVEFLRSHREIREFVFSGGDPLLLSDEVLEQRLADLRSIPHIETIRFNTAVFMHCPMRITAGLVRIFKQYDVTELGVHIVHPRFLTEECLAALDRLDAGGAGSIMRLAQIPLLGGVNDEVGVLRELLIRLERCHVKAYYLLHALPWTLGALRFRTPVFRGVELLRPLYRRLSHVAFPEYVIVARKGKSTVPLERNDFWVSEEHMRDTRVWAVDGTFQPLSAFALERDGRFLRYDGTPEFLYARYDGNPVIVFRNWKGEWEMYLDSE